jgi:hypothetical protein
MIIVDFAVLALMAGDLNVARVTLSEFRISHSLWSQQWKTAR